MVGPHASGADRRLVDDEATSGREASGADGQRGGSSRNDAMLIGRDAAAPVRFHSPSALSAAAETTRGGATAAPRVQCGHGIGGRREGGGAVPAATAMPEVSNVKGASPDSALTSTLTPSGAGAPRGGGGSGSGSADGSSSSVASIGDGTPDGRDGTGFPPGGRRPPLRAGRGRLPEGDGLVRMIFPPFFKPSLGWCDEEDDFRMEAGMLDTAQAPPVDGDQVRFANIAHPVAGANIDPGSMEVFIARVATVARPTGPGWRNVEWIWRCADCNVNFLFLPDLEVHYVNSHHALRLYHCRVHVGEVDEDEEANVVDDFFYLADLYLHYANGFELHGLFDAAAHSGVYYTPPPPPPGPVA